MDGGVGGFGGFGSRGRSRCLNYRSGWKVPRESDFQSVVVTGPSSRRTSNTASSMSNSPISTSTTAVCNGGAGEGAMGEAGGAIGDAGGAGGAIGNASTSAGGAKGILTDLYEDGENLCADMYIQARRVEMDLEIRCDAMT